MVLQVALAVFLSHSSLGPAEAAREFMQRLNSVSPTAQVQLPGAIEQVYDYDLFPKDVAVVENSYGRFLILKAADRVISFLGATSPIDSDRSVAWDDPRVRSLEDEAAMARRYLQAAGYEFAVQLEDVHPGPQASARWFQGLALVHDLPLFESSIRVHVGRITGNLEDLYVSCHNAKFSLPMPVGPSEPSFSPAVAAILAEDAASAQTRGDTAVSGLPELGWLTPGEPGSSPDTLSEWTEEERADYANARCRLVYRVQTISTGPQNSLVRGSYVIEAGSGAIKESRSWKTGQLGATGLPAIRLSTDPATYRVPAQGKPTTFAARLTRVKGRRPRSDGKVLIERSGLIAVCNWSKREHLLWRDSGAYGEMYRPPAAMAEELDRFTVSFGALPRRVQ